MTYGFRRHPRKEAIARNIINRWRARISLPSGTRITIVVGKFWAKDFKRAFNGEGDLVDKAVRGRKPLALTLGPANQKINYVFIDPIAFKRKDLENIMIHELVHVCTNSHVGSDIRENMEIATQLCADLLQEQWKHHDSPEL